MDLSKKEFILLLQQYLALMDTKSSLKDDDYLKIGYMLNTISKYPQLKEDNIARQFMKVGGSPDMTVKMVIALAMEIGRGFAYASTKYDFVLGGVLDEKYSYKITDLHN